jgi:hypothetical protein
VVSNTLFNQQTGLAMVCPLTTTDRGCGLLRDLYHVCQPIERDNELIQDVATNDHAFALGVGYNVCLGHSEDPMRISTS